MFDSQMIRNVKKPQLMEDRLLAAVARRLSSGRDRKTLQEAVTELENLAAVDDDVFDLKLRLKGIEKWRGDEYEKYPDPENLVAASYREMSPGAGVVFG